MAENTQSQQRLRMVNIIGPKGTVIANGVLISPNAEDVKVENEIAKTQVSANLKDFLFKKFSSTTESDGGDTIEIRAAGDDYFSIDPSKISILQSWSDYQNLNKKRLVGLYDSEGNYIADFLSEIENLDPTLAQFETTDIYKNIAAVIGLYDLKKYTPVTIEDEKIAEGTPVSAEDQAKELMASLGDSSFWQRLIERERADKDRLIGIYDEKGDLKGHFEPTTENLDAIVDLYNKGILCYENNITAADGKQSNQKVYKGMVTSLEDAYDLVIDLKKKSIYQHLIELKDFWIVLPFECYDNVEEAGHSIANKYDIDRLSWEIEEPANNYGLYFGLSADRTLEVIGSSHGYLRGEMAIPSMIGERAVTSIAPGAFIGKTTLRKIKDSDKINKVGALAFKGCVNLKEVNLTNLEEIGSQAFSGCTSLSSISLNNIKAIKDSVFAGCTSLKEITVPDSCTVLEGYAFDDCTGLTKVTIGKGITEIGRHTFDDCANLKSIDIQGSITAIGEEAFRNSGYYKNNENWDNEVLYYKKEITSGAFKYYLIEAKTNISGAYTVKDGTKLIAEKAFYDRDSLSSVTIPDSVEYINSSAFEGCDNLTQVQYNGDIASWCNISFDNSSANPLSNATTTGLYIKKSGTNEYELIKNLVIPNSITEIKDYAFYHCRSLEGATIPNSVTSIGSWAFSVCPSLTSIAVDTSNSAYKSIDENLYSKDEKRLIQYAIGKTDTSFAVPDGVTSVGDWAFGCCKNLTSVTIPSSVTSIGEHAFRECSKLTNINIPDGVTSIGYAAFRQCDLKSLFIPDSVKYIGNDAFYSCRSLTSVTIGSGVTSINNYTFGSCIALSDIIIPNNVTSIGRYAFSWCSSLKSIRIGYGVENISEDAFIYCSNLTDIYIDKPEDSVVGAPWGIENAIVHWNTPLPTEEA